MASAEPKPVSVATPSIGEFLRLSEGERLRAWELTLEESRKRPGVCAVAMTSCNCDGDVSWTHRPA